MPTWIVTDSNGRKVRLTGDAPPSSSDLDEIFAALPAPRPAADQPAPYTGPQFEDQSLPPQSAGELGRAAFTAEADAKTAAAAPDETWSKAQMAGAAGLGRALTDPLTGGMRLAMQIPGVDTPINRVAAGLLSRALAPLAEASADAEEAAAGMKGNETLAEVANAVGSGVGTMPYALVPGGAAVSAGAAGLQGFESTRRDALKLTMQAGIEPAEAEKIAQRVALQSGLITGLVTGAFNKFGGKIGLGKGVERGLSDAVKELTAAELKRSAAIPIVKAIFKEAAGEGVEEGFDQLLQEVITRWQYDPTKTVAEYAQRAVKDIGKAGMLGVVAGGVIGGAPSATEVIMERRHGIANALRGPVPPVLDRPVTGVPRDTAELAQPISMEPPAEPKPPAARDPGTYVFGALPDGRELVVTVPNGGSVDGAKEAMAKAWPTAEFSRVEVVASPEVSEPSQGTDAAGEAGGVHAPVAPPLAPATEEVIPNGQKEEGQGQDVLSTPGPAVEPAVPLSTPETPETPETTPAKRRRKIARDVIGDILDDIEALGGLMSRSTWKKKNKGKKLPPEYDDVPKHLGFHNFVYGNGAGGPGSLEPDRALQGLQSSHPGKYDDFSISDMWRAIESAARGRGEMAKARKAEIEDTKAAVDFDEASGPQDGADPVEAGDLQPGEVLTIDGEKLRVRGFDRFGDVILEDGKRFGRQRVSATKVLYIEHIEPQTGPGPAPNEVQQSPDAPFSLGQPGFFDAPESVADQKARVAREAADAKRREDRQKMLDRQAAPIIGRSVDTTGDMFDAGAASAPLFAQAPKAQPPKPAPAVGHQGELFSTAPIEDNDGGGMSTDDVTAELRRAFQGTPPARIVVSPEALTAGGRRVEGMLDRRTGEVTLFAPNLRTPADVRRVLRHESLHDVFDVPGVQAAWRTLRAVLAPDAEARVSAEGYTANQTEEALIDEAEARVDRKSGPFRQFVGSIVRAMANRGHRVMAGAVFGLDHLADADARALVGYAMRVERLQNAPSTGAEGRFSLGQDNEQGRQHRGDGTNPEALRGTAADPLVATAAFVRGSWKEAAGSRDGGRARARYQRLRLISWAALNGKILDRSILPTTFDNRGVEHRVWRHPSGKRVLKVTDTDKFGMSVDGEATPAEYLERWAVQNKTFGDDIRLEGVIVDGEHVRAVISQPFIDGRRSTIPEVVDWMIGEGFQPFEHDGHSAWYRPGDNLIAMDAHGGNVLTTPKGLVPIDLVLDHPKGELLTMLRSRFAHGDDVSPEDTGIRFSLATPTQVDAEHARQKRFGKVPTPISAGLAWSGAQVAEQTGATVFSKWAPAMIAKHGEEVRPFLGRAWEDQKAVRYAIAGGMPGAAQDEWARIATEAGAAPSMADRTPPPAYDPEKVKRWWHNIAKPSAVIRDLAGDALLHRKQILDIRTAKQQAAVNEQAENLKRSLENSFYGDNAGPLLRFFRQFMPKEKLRRFTRFALPIASRLNVTGGTAGAWTFEDFDQHAGFLPESVADRLGISTGATYMSASPIDGAMEILELGPKIELESGKKGFQLVRHLDAATQQAIYDQTSKEFPEFRWLIDTWVDPRLAGTRLTLAGVEVPIFNRHALAGRYAQSDPTFKTRPAYTPEVSMGLGLIGALKRRFQKERAVTFREGVVSPGRKYETGTARESGDVLDLISGFNVRSMQVLQEDVRKEWMNAVIGSAVDLPPEGMPSGWTKIENAMSSVWQAVQTLRKFDDPVNFAEVTDRFGDDDSPAYRKFFSEIMRLKKGDAPKILPTPLVEVLVKNLATVQELGLCGRIAQVVMRNSKAFMLLMPQTFLTNYLDNRIRFLMQAHRQMVLAGIRGGDRAAFREARNFVWTGIVGTIPGVRQVTGLNRNRIFERVKRDVLPAEVFAGGTSLQDLLLEKGNTDEEIQSHLAQGRFGRAAGVALREIGPLILEKTGYGKMDVAAKQQFAFAALVSAAETEGHRRGLQGPVFEGFVESFLLNPPEEQARRAVEAANKALLDYSDSPEFLARFTRNPISHAVVAFPLYAYHFTGREIEKATAAFRAAFNVGVRGKKLTRDQWTEALADTISAVMLPATAYAGTKAIGAIAAAMLGAHDDDDDSREVVGSSERIVEKPDGTTGRKKMARELVTANRLNMSAIMRRLGVDTGNPQDYWLAIKNYPLLRSAALTYAAVEDARKFGPAQGRGTFMTGLRDMLESIVNVGPIPKVIFVGGHKAYQADRGDTPTPSDADPYATAVPLDAYLTLQALSLVPAQRQANELLKWVDPVPRRITKSKVLEYDPGMIEALQSEGWTGLADRVARAAMTGSAASPLPPQGTINRRTATVDEPRTFDLMSRLAALAGQNVKPVPRSEYRDALSE